MLQIKLFDRNTCIKMGKYLDTRWGAAFGLAPVADDKGYDAPVFQNRWLSVISCYQDDVDISVFETSDGHWQIPFCFVKNMREVDDYESAS